MFFGSIHCGLKAKWHTLAVLLCVVPALSQAQHTSLQQQRTVAQSIQQPIQHAVQFVVKPAHLSIYSGSGRHATLNWLGVKQGQDFVMPRLISKTQGEHYTEFKRVGVTDWYKPLNNQIEHGITLFNDDYAQHIGVLNKRKKIQLRFELTSPELDWRADGVKATRVLGLKDGKPVLEYGNLVAFDSNGKALPSSMTFHPKQHSAWVDIDVDVTHAKYPVVIDPLFTPDTSKNIVPSDLKKDAYFARSISNASTNNTQWLFVGSAPVVRSVNPANVAGKNNQTNVNNGVDAPVLVFKQVQKTNGFDWVKHSEIPAIADTITPQASTQFGYAVAQWDDWLAISAPNYQQKIQFSDGVKRPVQQGAVHFYQFDANQKNGAGEWVFQQTLLYPFDKVADAKMGIRMVFENGVLAVSAPFEGDNVGRVFLAVKNGQNNWGYLGASGSTPLFGLTAKTHTRCNKDLFGTSLAMHGDYLVVGRPLAVEGCNTQNKGLKTGAVHVFKKQNTGSSSGQWVETQVLYPPNKRKAQGDAFGHSVAVNADHLLVGAIYAKNKKRVTTGVVYPYELNASGQWVVRSNPASSLVAQTIAPKNGASGMVFGFSLALNGNDVLIGAAGSGWSGYDGTIGQDVNANRVGEVHVYAFKNGAWQYSQVIPSLVKTIRGQLFGMTLGWLKNNNMPLIGSPLAVNKNNVRSGYLQQYKQADDVVFSRIQMGQSGLSSMVKGTVFDVTITLNNKAPLYDSETHKLFIDTKGLPITLSSSPSDFLCNLTQQNRRYACELPVMPAGSQRQVRFEFEVGAFSSQMREAIEFIIAPSVSKAMIGGEGVKISKDVFLNHPPQIQILGANTVQTDYNNLKKAVTSTANPTVTRLVKMKVTDKDQAQTFCSLNASPAFSCKTMGLNKFGLFVNPRQINALKSKNDVYVRISDGVDMVTEKVTVHVANVPNTATDSTLNSAPNSSGKASFGLHGLFFLLLTVLAWWSRIEARQNIATSNA